MHTIFPTLDAWLAYCERLHPQNIALGLDRVREVAQRMGLQFDCPVITVAGTNGKGSTCAFLASLITSSVVVIYGPLSHSLSSNQSELFVVGSFELLGRVLLL